MDKTQENRSLIIAKSNKIIQQTRYELSLTEQKIVLFLISQIKKDDDEFRRYEISLNDMCKLCGITVGGKNYQYFRKTLKGLQSKSFWVKDGHYSHLIQWVCEVSIDDENGIISARLDTRLKPYLLNLKNNYTLYQLYNVLAMRSKYSIRLYELLKSYAYKGTAEFTFDELKELTDTKETYPLYNNFKQKVLNPAISEINDFTDLNITLRTIRKSNHLQKIIFDINVVEQEQLILPLYEYIDKILSEPKKRIRKKPKEKDKE